MKKRNIYLVGFMGAGKSTIAKELSKQLGYELLSTDALIVDREGKEITDIFKDEGEIYFRKVEKEVVNSVSQKTKVIIDCGGGIVLDPENISNLKKRGIVIYLSATPESIFSRVKDHTHRPLLNVDDPMRVIIDLLGKRQPFYEQANYIINTDNRSIQDVCLEIINILKSNE